MVQWELRTLTPKTMWDLIYYYLPSSYIFEVLQYMTTEFRNRELVLTFCGMPNACEYYEPE